MVLGIMSSVVLANETAASAEKNANDLFRINASESYAGEEGETGATVVTKNVSVDGINALEIVNNHTEKEFERISVDISGCEFPKGALLEANFASVE